MTLTEMTGSGACGTCGASFHPWEFRFDTIGRTILHHRCDPVAIARYHARHERYGGQSCEAECVDCGKTFTGTWSSVRCKECRGLRTTEELKAIRLANLAKARARPCCECKRSATKNSPRCRYHQKQYRIRSGIKRRSAA